MKNTQTVTLQLNDNQMRLLRFYADEICFQEVPDYSGVVSALLSHALMNYGSLHPSVAILDKYCQSEDLERGAALDKMLANHVATMADLGLAV